MPVAHVLIVALVTLMVGSFLNAAGIRKTALSQPVGWKRDVSRFFAEPLYDVSHFIGADRVRSGLQDLIGRKGDDHVNPRLPSPTDGTENTSATTTPPRRLAFSPA